MHPDKLDAYLVCIRIPSEKQNIGQELLSSKFHRGDNCVSIFKFCLISDKFNSKSNLLCVI